MIYVPDTHPTHRHPYLHRLNTPPITPAFVIMTSPLAMSLSTESHWPDTLCLHSMLPRLFFQLQRCVCIIHISSRVGSAFMSNICDILQDPCLSHHDWLDSEDNMDSNHSGEGSQSGVVGPSG